MLLKGQYGSAKVFTHNIEAGAISQIINLLNQDFIEGSKIRIMPDVHQGAGCVIGFTAELGEKVIPNLVGVDIGCGMLTIELGQLNIDLAKLDQIIHDYIPAGFNTHEAEVTDFVQMENLHIYKKLKDIQRIKCSIGTLGGGNHFIEVEQDESQNKFLIIHSGSRNLGHQIATHYQDLAIELCKDTENYNKEQKKLIKALKEKGKQHEIQSALKKLKRKHLKSSPNYPASLCFLTDENREWYLHDMRIAQEYAILNRETIAELILQKLGTSLSFFPFFHTIHNYIDFTDNIVRKGAISAYQDEKVLIPINMRDGSILATGRGNPDWNYSAPHGAGRLMSRSEAKEKIDLIEFLEMMEGVYTTSVKENTLDEAPMAYKNIEEIIDNVQETVNIQSILKPIYNFKSS